MEHYDYKGTDRSGRQKHERKGTVQTVRPSGKSSCLLPAVLFTAIDTSTNFIYLSERVHEELLDACSWVAPDNQVHVVNKKTTDSALSARELGLCKKTERPALYFLLKSAILPLLPPLMADV